MSASIVCNAAEHLPRLANIRENGGGRISGGPSASSEGMRGTQEAWLLNLCVRTSEGHAVAQKMAQSLLW